MLNSGSRRPFAAGTLSLIIVLLAGLLLLQGCAGKGGETNGAGDAASGPFNYTNFENGSLSRETGSLSNGTTNSLRSADFIAVSDLITAQIDMDYSLSYFAYDINHHYLGASDRESVLLSGPILERFPSCTHIKLLIESNDGSKLDPAALDTYGLIVQLRSEYKSRSAAAMALEEVGGEIDGKDTRSVTVYLDSDSVSAGPQLLTCTSCYQSASSSYPSIQLFLMNEAGEDKYTSPLYRLGEAGDALIQNQWRIPPYQRAGDQIRIQIVIPDDVVLTIDGMQAQEDTASNARDAVLYQAYQGFSSLCPPTTLPAFWMAGELGYQSCVITPQFTSDDVCVCFQDTATIRNLLRYPDGSEIEAGGPDDRPVSGFTYDELMQFDAGIKTDPGYSGKKVPSLDQFFDICAQYDMAPVLSIPSEREYMYGSGRSRLSSIRDMAEQYGVLDTLRIKGSDREVLRAAESVFGQDIAGYIIVPPSGEDWDPLDFVKTLGFAGRSAESMQDSDYSIVIEFSAFTLTQEMIRNAMDEGFPVSVEAAGSGISGPVMERLIEMGVSEFTLNSHCSIGLNW